MTTAKNPQTRQDCELLLTDFVERSKHAKQEICKEVPMTDNPPVFLCVFQPEKDDFEGDYDQLEEEAKEMGLSRVLQVGMIPLVHKPDVYDCLSDLFSMLPISKFEFAFVAVEGFMDTDPNKWEKIMSGDDDDYERGDMAKDFAENPFTTIREALVVHGFDWNKELKSTVFVPYRYDDKGVPIYEEGTTSIEEIGEDYEPKGRLEQMVFAGVSFANVKHATHKFAEKMESMPKKKKKKSE
jgi:hypothetical protein